MTEQETSPDVAPTGDDALIEAFVAAHFTPRGALRLHRHALGWDLLRAPANVVLAPVFLLVRLSAILARLLRLRRAAEWLLSRQILFRSDVSRAVSRAVLDEVIRPRGRPAEIGPDALHRIRDYADTRNAVSEMVTTVAVLILGFAVFRILTPGIVSLAPLISTQRLHGTAVANFPLGQTLGGVWYGWFPVDLPVWYVVLVGVSLAAAASLVTTFAGLIADPLQTWLGIHRRRLRRLLSDLDAGAAPGIAREHLLARLADLSDASVALLRAFRP